jgi:UDP-4-amino-4,6-dideoxy-N-acetyl-beta-L-altrosamine transaminase
MRKRFLGYGRQNIGRGDIDAVVAVLESDFLTQGPQVERFEAALAERVGARHAVAVSSGTAALHVACLAAGIGPGDLGLTSAITFAASANCLIYAGAEVAFLDIDPGTLGMARPALSRALAATPGIRAIIPVHLAGLADETAEIRKLAVGRIVIEDAAHALGGAYACGTSIGSCVYSDLTIFSFHPVKQITTGEGGAVLTNDPELAHRLRLLRSHGIEREPKRFVGNETWDDGQVKPWLGEQQLLGFNYRMTDIAAALGLSQLKKLDRFLERRRAIVGRYDEAFAKLAPVRLLQSAPEQRARSAHHLYVAWFDFAAMRTSRAAFMTKLGERGVGGQVHYMPVYHHPFHAARGVTDRSKFPNAEAYYDGCLSLPLHPGLTDEEVEHVIEAVTGLVSIA